jgi:DNA-directed RNA polymerase specialized sigma24 family protein
MGIGQLALAAEEYEEMAAAPLTEVARAAARVRRAEEALRRAREDLRAAILAARDNGETFAAIARTLGVTRQRVKQIAGG